jgi:chromosomal replication initiation ATPase DnaA
LSGGARRWRQLPLPFAHQPHFAAADFLTAACNAEAMAWLSRAPDWPQGRLALWGGEGTGKTHLAHIWADRAGATLLHGPVLPQLAAADRPVAVDNADACAERPLLHLLNTAAEAGQPVLLTGRLPPARWTVALPDLASRLRAIMAVEVRPPDDELLRVLLARLLAERQIAVPEAVQDWLLPRLPRTPAAMREVAARLDRAGLATGHRIGRAVAASVLAGMSGDDREPEGGTDQEDFASTGPPGCNTPPRLL